MEVLNMIYFRKNDEVIEKYQVSFDKEFSAMITRKSVCNLQGLGVKSPLCCYRSVAQSCPTLGDPIDCSRPGFPVLHHLLELAQTHVHLHTDSDPASAEYGILSGR